MIEYIELSEKLNEILKQQIIILQEASKLYDEIIEKQEKVKTIELFK